MLEGVSVRLERAEIQNDKHDRTLGYTWIKNGVENVNFNKLLLEGGLARLDVSDPNTNTWNHLRKLSHRPKLNRKTSGVLMVTLLMTDSIRRLCNNGVR